MLNFCETIAGKLYPIALILALSIGAHTACYAQGIQYTGKSEEDSKKVETLEERVKQFWNLRKAGDLLSLYNFEAVSSTGQSTLRQYINRSGKLIYKDFNILEIKIESENEAFVEIVTEVVVPGLQGTVSSQFKDQWIKIEDQWYHKGRVKLPQVKID